MRHSFVLFGHLRHLIQRCNSHSSIYIDEKRAKEIQQATRKGWVLGSDRYKNEIEQLLQRRTRPLPECGDRCSVEFQKQRG